MERSKQIRRKIIKSLRQSIKTPAELANSFEHIKTLDITPVIQQMLHDGELIFDIDGKLDLWRPR